MDNICRVWDLRTGRSIMVLKGHNKHVLTLDWSPNGHHLVTGSEDHTLRVWDIRSAASIYTVPAHKNIVSSVKYFTAGRGFMENDSGADFNFANSDNENPAMEVDRKGENLVDDYHQDWPEEDKLKYQVLNGSVLVSSSYDGTCKIWTDGDYKPLKSLTGLEGKITSCDFSGGKCVFFCSI
jgi:U4/U6 small nuclear ribonucleoprotein PRP4